MFFKNILSKPCSAFQHVDQEKKDCSYGIGDIPLAAHEGEFLMCAS